MRHSEYSPSTKRPEMMMTSHGHHLHNHHQHHHQPDGHFHTDLVASLQLVRGSTTTSGMTTATYDSDRKPAVTKMSDHRRSNKPIMEKRRRARINSCLGELKGLILQAMKKDPARHSKLEKADILEMTVKHLQNVQRQQMAMAVSTDPTVMTKFRAGFNECAGEVAGYVNRIDGVDTGVRQRLIAHLRSCITGLGHLPPVGLTSSATATTMSSPDKSNVGGTMLRMLAGLHLVPSRLPNGDIAFVLPHHQQHRGHHGTGGVRRSSASPQQLPSLSSSSDMSGDENEDDDDSRSIAAEPGSMATDRRQPSAFSSIQSHSTLEPVANGTVTSSTMSPTSTSSNGGCGSDVAAPGSSRQPSSSSTAVDGSTIAKPENGHAQSNTCTTDKMWRPW